MAEKYWERETPERREVGHEVDRPGYEVRQEVVENTALEQHQALTKMSQIIWLLLGILEATLGLRVFLRLIGANPESPFAAMVYSVTDMFLWPFAGLTEVPGFGNYVLEIPTIIAMFVYAVFAWVIVKAMWLLFHNHPTRTVTRYERDRDVR